MSRCVLRRIRGEKVKESILPVLLNSNNSLIKSESDTNVSREDISNEVSQKISKEKECVSYFIIENKNIIPFDFTDEDEGICAINKAKNIDPVINFLKESNNSNKDIYLKILENFKKKLSKIISNMEDEVLDTIDEETCENWTNDFFDVVEKFFIDKIMVSIYRTLINSYEDKPTFNFFKEFLLKINNYLNENGIYTYKIYPNEKLKDEDFNYVDLIASETNNNKEHNLIKEIEKLPYFIDYKDEYGEKEILNSKGKVYVLSFKS